jgi:hypothetical protein
MAADLAVCVIMSSPLNGLEGSPRQQRGDFLENAVPLNIVTGKPACRLDLEACCGETVCYVPVAVRAAPLPRTPSTTRCMGGASRSSEEPGLRPNPISLATAERRAAYFGATIG